MPVTPTLPSNVKPETAHLYGLSQSHLVSCQQVLLEQRTATAFAKMAFAAQQAGFDLQICSAYRSFERQMAIWNAKANGNRPALDKYNQVIDITTLTADEVIDSILLWSALPGASRHHWGTDIDVFDANNINKQDLQLISSEYQIGGPCHKLSAWLQQHAHSFGFYFPFQAKLSGVSPEPWHLSYVPVAKDYLAAFSTSQLREVLEHFDVTLAQELLQRLDELVAKYVNFIAPYPQIAANVTSKTSND